METYRTTRPERPMLMIDLLRHTSGLTYGFQQTTNVDAGYRKLQVGERIAGATLDDMIAQACAAAAGVLARHGVELFAFDRCARDTWSARFPESRSISFCARIFSSRSE